MDEGAAGSTASSGGGSVANTRVQGGLSRPKLPAAFVTSDEASIGAQRAFVRLRQAELGLLILAAITAAIPLPDIPLTSRGVEPGPLLGGAMFFLAGLLETSVVTIQPERNWYAARAIAESIKTLAWRFAVAGLPFACDLPDAEARVFARIQQITAQFPELGILVGVDHHVEVTGWMRSIRQSSLEQRREIYLRSRIEDQRRWYASKSQWNRRRANLWSIITLLFQFGGVAAGFGQAFLHEPVDFLPMIAAMGAAVLAWLQIKQHSTLAESYAVAATELSAVLAAAPLPGDESAWAHYVDEAENAVSREHTMWRAKRSQ